MIHLPKQEWLEWPATRALVEAFAQSGHEMRFVGGAVRNALLGRKVEDVDVATPATPQQVTTLLEEANIKAVPTGIDHGTVTAVTHGKHFEITTLRRDVTTDGRHAEVAFTDNWKEDAARRDFTMNALYATPQGEIFDYWGGVEDAKAGRVIFIGDARQRIREDGLRILRFFRFFAHYGQALMEAQALAACAELKGMIDALSGERIHMEMMKLLAAPRVTDVLAAMQQAGILAHVLPSGVQVPDEEGDVQDSLLRLALLLRSSSEGKKAVEWVSKRWKLSGAMRTRLLALVAPALSIKADMDEKAQKKAIRRLGKAVFCDLTRLQDAEEKGKHTQAYAAMRALAGAWQPPQFPITGDDLLALGFSQGPEFGRLLTRLEEEWEAEDYKPGKEALLRGIKD